MFCILYSMLRYQIFTDPFYGSERYIEFEPAWVVKVEEKMMRLFPWRTYPVTAVTFTNGRQYTFVGHLAAQIAVPQT